MIDVNKIELHESWKYVNEIKKVKAIDRIKKVSSWINSFKIVNKTIGLRLMPYIVSKGNSINLTNLDDMSFLVLTVKYGPGKAYDISTRWNLESQNMLRAGMPLANMFDIDTIKRLLIEVGEIGNNNIDPYDCNTLVLLHEYCHFVQGLNRGKMKCYHPVRAVQAQLFERCSYVNGLRLYRMYLMCRDEIYKGLE